MAEHYGLDPKARSFAAIVAGRRISFEGLRAKKLTRRRIDVLLGEIAKLAPEVSWVQLGSTRAWPADLDAGIDEPGDVIVGIVTAEAHQVMDPQFFEAWCLSEATLDDIPKKLWKRLLEEYGVDSFDEDVYLALGDVTLAEIIPAESEEDEMEDILERDAWVYAEPDDEPRGASVARQAPSRFGTEDYWLLLRD